MTTDHVEYIPVMHRGRTDLRAGDMMSGHWFPPHVPCSVMFNLPRSAQAVLVLVVAEEYSIVLKNSFNFEIFYNRCTYMCKYFRTFLRKKSLILLIE